MVVTLTPSMHLVARADVLGSAVGDDTTILLDPSAGRYYSVEGAGVAVWAGLAEPTTLSALCARVEAEYAVDHATCLRDVEAIVIELIQSGLVRLVTPPDAR